MRLTYDYNDQSDNDEYVRFAFARMQDKSSSIERSHSLEVFRIDNVTGHLRVRFRAPDLIFFANSILLL